MEQITVSSERNILGPNSLSFDERKQQLEKENEAKKKAEENAKKSPYKDFVQVNKDYYKAEDWLMAKSPVAYRIFRFLVNGMDGYNAVVCSYQVLQETFNISQVTVARAIKILKDKKYVDVHKSGTSNVYSINKNIVWNSWGTNYKYAKFGANIIISENEQSLKSKTKTVKQKEIKLNED